MRCFFYIKVDAAGIRYVRLGKTPKECRLEVIFNASKEKGCWEKKTYCFKIGNERDEKKLKELMTGAQESKRDSWVKAIGFIASNEREENIKAEDLLQKLQAFRAGR